MPALVSVTLQKLEVTAPEYLCLEVKVREVIKLDAEAGLVYISKGKNGGVCRPYRMTNLSEADFKRMTVAFMAGAVEARIPLYSVLKRLGVGVEVAYNWRADVNAGRMLSDSSRTNMPAQDSYLNSLLDAASTAGHDNKVSARLDYRATRKGARKLQEDKVERKKVVQPHAVGGPATRPGTSDAALDALTPRYQTDEET